MWLVDFLQSISWEAENNVVKWFARVPSPIQEKGTILIVVASMTSDGEARL